MITCQSIQKALTNSLVGVPQANGLFHKLLRCCPTPAAYLCGLCFWLCRTRDILSQEIRSLFRRIAARYREPNYLPVGRSYSNCSPIQRLFLNSYNHARSACISEMAANHPWANRGDLQILLEGWDKGEKWAIQTYSPESCIGQSAANTQAFGDYTPVPMPINSN